MKDPGKLSTNFNAVKITAIKITNPKIFYQIIACIFYTIIMIKTLLIAQVF